MELKEKEYQQGEAYLSNYERLMGDERSRKTFNEIIYGIIGSESLHASQIARFSPWAGDGGAWGTAGTTHGR
jgi:hypothetical protein